MELNHLKYFYFVAKEGGFSKASRALRIAQPAITKTVKTLESNLGVQLFERHGRTITLTKEGSDIYRRCEIIFSQVEGIRAGNDPSHQLKGALNIGAAEPVASHVLPTALRRLLQVHPDIYPQVLSSSASEVVRNLSRKRIDMAFLFHAPELPEGVEIRARYPVPFSLVVADGKERSESVCSSFIGSREVDDVGNKVYPTLNKLRKVHPKAEIKISTNSLTAHKQMVLDGLGVSILPDFLVREELKTGTLKRLLPEEPFRFDLKLITRKGELKSPISQTFVEQFATALPDLV